MSKVTYPFLADPVLGWAEKYTNHFDLFVCMLKSSEQDLAPLEFYF